ncbi:MULTISPECIES: hypothetical protein [Streptomyces]|uniref:Aminoglycoside phosphotransferase domain-containing protein n=1 Tax=Streptomyces edwardsiae TaxID=3075527 RepID=A0ABU2QE48_9ACTN|nr:MULTISPECIES: hypothetical protein [unclassified Streptomyces]MDT0402696.1 hypothetical protein [Streptomyces sp. DSM 41635]
MALDRSLSLWRGFPDESAEQVRSRAVRVLAEAVRDDRSTGPGGDVSLHRLRSDREGCGTWLYLPPGPRHALTNAVDRLRTGRGCPYEILEGAGVLVMGSAGARADAVVLSGGSHCDVLLRTRGKHSVITKAVSKSGASRGADGLHRHRNEAEWLALVGRESDLFPRARVVEDSAESYAFDTDFFPGYSAAELVFQRRMSGERLAGILVRVYEELRTGFYCRPPVPVGRPDPDAGYVAKIRRRCRLTRAALKEAGTPLGALLGARRVRVNGRPCPSIPDLLARIETDPFWQPVVRPRGAHACHGDLILEDILVGRGPAHEVMLIDPNPYNRHGLLDLAKTMLSLWVGYEFVYFDFFEVTVRTGQPEGCVSVDVVVDADEFRKEYADAAERFMGYARTELPDVLGLPRNAFDRMVRMAAALTALALPAFHLIRHNRPDRALAFAALGILHASYALADETPG